jgi:DNA-directed RNA polymerase sigma subunit (sigma70/sigma32)
MISRRFAIGQARRHTLQELSQRLGISRERVRQIEREALTKPRGSGQILWLTLDEVA